MSDGQAACANRASRGSLCVLQVRLQWTLLQALAVECKNVEEERAKVVRLERLLLESKVC